MGKVTIYTMDGCTYCKRAKELLTQKGVAYEEISLTSQPEWRPLLYLMTGGGRTVPKIFFNNQFIGGATEIEALEQGGKLAVMLKETTEATADDFPPPLRNPRSEEFLQVFLSRQTRFNSKLLSTLLV